MASARPFKPALRTSVHFHPADVRRDALCGRHVMSRAQHGKNNNQR